ncbi:hypothetical protein AA637_11925 [Cyanobacterium sp. HL-69]|nr:hypothetical protein AA637_11925 [Cyanobacterium sp. HL-69]
MRVSIDKINGILVLYKIKKQRQSLIIQLPLFSVNITSLTINNSSKIEIMALTKYLNLFM